MNLKKKVVHKMINLKSHKFQINVILYQNYNYKIMNIRFKVFISNIYCKRKHNINKYLLTIKNKQVNIQKYFKIS